MCDKRGGRRERGETPPANDDGRAGHRKTAVFVADKEGEGAEKRHPSAVARPVGAALAAAGARARARIPIECLYMRFEDNAYKDTETFRGFAVGKAR